MGWVERFIPFSVFVYRRVVRCEWGLLYVILSYL